MKDTVCVLPFERQVLLRSQDVCEAKELLNSIVDYREFTALKSSSDTDILIASQALQKTKLLAARWGTDISARSVSLNCYYLIIPMAGEIYSHRSKASISKGDVFIFPPGSFTDLIWNSAAQAIVIALDPVSLNEYFNLQANIPVDDREIILTNSDKAASNLLNIINCIVQDSLIPLSLLQSERAQRSWEQLLFEALALCRPELEQLNSPSVLPHSLKLAIEYIQENLHQSITMQDLVALTNTSRRSLESSFRNNFQTSPMKFVTHKKLEAVRQVLLKSHSEEATISEVAERFGFNHASHFSALYQRNYSEKPSDTLQKMP